MHLARKLLLVGGIANVLFALFHLFLGWQFHHLQAAPPLRAALEMLNGSTALLILFFAVASLGYATEVLTSRLGAAVLALATTLYALRGAAEFVVAAKPAPTIVILCAATAGLYATALLLPRGLQRVTAC